MAQINQDGILFTKVRTSGLPAVTGIYIPGFNGVDPDDGGLINAVDIDWNKAKLELPESLGGTQYVTSSGQLLSIIKNMADLISSEEPEPEPQPTYYTCTCYVANGSGIVDGGTNTKTVSVVKNSQSQFTITPNAGYTTDGATVQNGTINGYIVTSDPVDINGFMVTVECMLAYTYSYVEPTRTLQSIMWSGGSVSPTTINEGSTGTFNKGTVTAVFDNGDLVNVTSNAIFTQYINNISKGTISGTSVTAPSVSANSTVTIKASYGGKIASETVTYTAKDVPAETYYWYIGSTQPTASNYTSIATQVTSYESEFTWTPTERAYQYALVKDNKTVQFIDMSLNTPYDTSVDTDTISGYKIFKTLTKIAITPVKIKIS